MYRSTFHFFESQMVQIIGNLKSPNDFTISMEFLYLKKAS